jgi:hypothetical protein
VTQVNGQRDEEVGMKRKAMVAFLLMTVVTFMGAALASAEDFNITVPVKVMSWPREVAQGQVWCWVGPADMPLLNIGGLGPDGSGKVIGRGKPSFPIDRDTGGFSGSIVVRFSADPGKNPGDATKYWCELTSVDSQGYPRLIDEQVRTKPGAPLSTSVSGSLVPLPVREAPPREMLKK